VTGDHDLQVKIRQARQFFADGDKVLVCCLFRGRQIAHKEVGEQVINEVVKELADVAKVEAGIRVEGKRMVLLLSKK
jgi:translation initiation factor IF-3